MKGRLGSGHDQGTSSEVSKLLVEVTILVVLFCWYTVRYYITNLLHLDG